MVSELFNYINRIFNKHELIKYLAITELRVEFSQSAMSFLWWILEPLIYMMMFYLIFGVFISRGTGVENYIYYLIVGLVTWKWLNVCLISSSNVLKSYKGVINDTLIEIPVFFAIQFLKNTIKFTYSFILLLVFLLFTGFELANPLKIILFFFIASLLTSGIMLFVGSISPFYPSIEILLPTITQALFFTSGVFFPVDGIIKAIPIYEYLNPILMLIDFLRQILIYEDGYSVFKIIWLITFSALFWVFGVLIMYKNQSEYAKYV